LLTPNIREADFKSFVLSLHLFSSFGRWSDSPQFSRSLRQNKAVPHYEIFIVRVLMFFHFSISFHPYSRYLLHTLLLRQLVTMTRSSPSHVMI
jgi:hypothetical protein